MDIKSELAKVGASATQVNSAVVQMVENIMCKSEGVSVDTANAKVKELERRAEGLQNTMNGISDDIRRLEAMHDKLYRECQKFNGNAKALIIEDKDTKDALNLYTAMLTQTKEILGEEKLTEPVIIQLLESASYAMWRSIMGGKSEIPKANRRLQ